MATLVPVDNDPFAAPPPQQAPVQQAPAPVAANGPQLVPVDHDPFADQMVRVPIVSGRAGITGYRMVPQSQLDAGTTGALEDAGRVAGNSMTLGGLDNAIAGGEALAGSGDYQSNLKEQHADTAQAMQRPGAQFLSNASALAPGILGLGAAATGARLLGAGALGTYAAGAGAGGALAGTDAFMTSDGTPMERLQASIKPIAFGTGLGIAGPAIAEGAGSLLSAGASKVMNALYDSQYGSTLPRQGADSILSSLGNQQQNVAQAGQAVQNLGPGAVLADSGPGTQAQVGQLATRDMDASPTIVNNLTAREPMFGQRVNDVVDQNVGPDLNAVTQMQNLKATTAANGKQFYDAARANPNAVDVSPVLQQIDSQTRPGLSAMVGTGVNDDTVTSALQRARSLIAGDGTQAVNIGTLHAAQDDIDDMASAASRAGKNAQAAALWGVRTNLLKQMDAVNPEYGVARSQYASDKSIENAFRFGRDVLATRTDGEVFDPDLLESRLAQMSQPEQQAYQLGARKSITDVMGLARNDPAGLRTKLANDNGYAVGKLRLVFGDQPVNNILQELDNQATMRTTNAGAISGSKTAISTASNESIPGFEPNAKAASGHHETIPLLMMSGEEVGRHIGSMAGYPEFGSAAGTVLGPGISWAANKLAASSAAQTAAEQGAARQGMARALTTPGQEAVMRALASRESTAQVPANTSIGTQKIIKALMMQQAAKGKNSALYPLIPQSFSAP